MGPSINAVEVQVQARGERRYGTRWKVEQGWNAALDLDLVGSFLQLVRPADAWGASLK
jgi:hypothetical protein